jgi:hypothetical protein
MTNLYEFLNTVREGVYCELNDGILEITTADGNHVKLDLTRMDKEGLELLEVEEITWYCVTTYDYSRDYRYATITESVVQDETPYGSESQYQDCTVFRCWFCDLEQAENFVKMAKSA